MRISMVCAGLLGLLQMGTVAQAQVTFDMTKVTCADYLAMPSDTARDFSAWMSGWFNGKASDSSLNLEGYRKNVANVRSWCSSNPKESVFAGLQRAVPAAKQGTPGPTDINMAQFTCGQFTDMDPDNKMLLHSWFSGYFSSSKNLTNVDVRYVERNAKVVSAFCAKNKKQTLMSVIAKKAK